MLFAYSPDLYPIEQAFDALWQSGKPLPGSSVTSPKTWAYMIFQIPGMAELKGRVLKHYLNIDNCFSVHIHTQGHAYVLAQKKGPIRAL